MDVRSEILSLWLIVDEPIGATLGVVVVLCLIRQNLWAWPLGVVYVLTSISVLIEGRLYANLLLHVAGFLPMNLYGWYCWIHSKGKDRNQLSVSWSGWNVLGTLTVMCFIIAALLGNYFYTSTGAAFPFMDSGVFVMSLAAMWLTAHKKIDNWFVWFLVNVMSVYLYFSQGLTLYGLLYIAYIGMAVVGFIEWRKTMNIPEDGHIAAKT